MRLFSPEKRWKAISRKLLFRFRTKGLKRLEGLAREAEYL